MKNTADIRCFCLGILLTGASLLSGQNQDSLFLYFDQLPDRELVERVNEQWYQLYSKDFDKAEALGERALAICEKVGYDTLAAATLKNLGVVSYSQGKYEASLDYYQRSLDAYKRLNDASGQGRVLNELAIFASKNKQPEKAFEYLDQAAQLCEQAGDSICFITSLDNRGLLHLRRGQLAPADSLFRRVLLLRQHCRDSVGLGYVLANLATVATERNQFEEATDYLQQSTNIRQQINDLQGVAVNINNLGEILLLAGKPEAAIPPFKESLQKSTVLAFNDLRRHTMLQLTTAYSELGEFQEALHWQQQAHNLQDSLFNKERTAQIAEMQEKYDAVQREEALTREKLRVRQRTSAVILLGLSSILLTITLVFVYYRQKQTWQANQLREQLLRSESDNRLREDRLRISRDLHDHLGAELTLIGAAIEQQAQQSTTTVQQDALQEIRQDTRKVMSELRETIWAIRAEEDTIPSLAVRLRGYAGRLSDTCTLHLSWAPELADSHLRSSHLLHLFRIAQESINNAIRHGQANEINLHFAQQPTLTMEITDNGSGFDPANASAGYGLPNMQARAEEIGATFQLTSNARGTSIKVTLPSENT